MNKPLGITLGVLAVVCFGCITLGVLAMLCFGCDAPQPVKATVEMGYIRSVQPGLGTNHRSFVTIETETGYVHTLIVTEDWPPVWQGLHGEFRYYPDIAGRVQSFVVTRRLP